MPRKNSDLSTQTRRNLIKRILKQAPEDGYSVTEIYEIFTKEPDQQTSRKTVERDIEYLSQDHGVYVINEEASTKHYAISEDYAENLEITVSEEHLQIINLALGLLSKLGPASLSRIAADTENALVETLPTELKNDFENFKTLQSIQSSLAGKAILENDKDLGTVLLALRKGRMIEGDYFSKHRGVTERRELGPIFIELFGGAPYLLAEDPDDKENPIKRFKLSRLSDTKILSTRYTPPEKEECEHYLNSFAGVGGEKNEITKIQITGNRKLAEHFEEFELHPSQSVTKLSEEEYLLEFEMPLSYPFFRYMAGFGGYISHIEPIEAMRQIRAIWRKGAESMGLEVQWKN